MHRNRSTKQKMDFDRTVSEAASKRNRRKTKMGFKGMDKRIGESRTWVKDEQHDLMLQKREENVSFWLRVKRKEKRSEKGKIIGGKGKKKERKRRRK